MTWLALLKLLLTITDKLFGYIQQENLMNAGEARAIATQMEELNDRVKKALEARDTVARDAADGKLHDDDGYRQD